VTTLMVANDGGHLMQLFTLAPRLGLGTDHLWMTVKTPQTESLLKGREVVWMNPAPTRDVKACARNAVAARRALSSRSLTSAVSTVASLALSVLPMARMRGLETFYVESATRVDGPSLTGRAMAALPGIRTFTQHRGWADRRWEYRGSVLDGYQCIPGGREAAVPLRKVVVSLGTQGFGFRRLVERLVSILPAETEVLWQTGSTDVSGLGVDARPRVPAAQLFAAMREADVVVSHAGTGAALAALQAGHVPVLVPRRPEFDEHVDDHQLQISGMLAQRGLAVVREAGDLDADALLTAAGTLVRTPASVPPVDLRA
jgi:UDP-N-acetylglucosamine transferase subunit ALG13